MKSRPEFVTKRTKAVPLLEELFPEEAGTEYASARKKERHVPRLVLPSEPETVETRIRRIPSGPGPGQSQAPLVRRVNTAGFIEGYVKGGQEQGKLPTVLVLHNASKSLVESDFRRIIPDGKYIKGWKGEGDILKVIPGRDPNTLSPLGFYYILFSTPSSAHAYRDHVLRLHRLSRTYTPHSLQSPIAPPPGYLIDGEDVHTLLQSYNLVPPSQNLTLKTLTPPFSTTVQRLLRNGGYERLKMRNALTTDNTVLIHIDGGPHLTTRALQKVLDADGRHTRNGMPWRLAGDGRPISKLDAPLEPDEDAPEVVPAPKRPAPVAPRWLVEFADRDEASRFVRAWHKRPLPLTQGPISQEVAQQQEEDPGIVDAELVW
ncbi:MAG: hypothetical protein M1832_004667 [Thelocarpon impressellum]|nr:MAG: hypothetical protein M1832_004667 [Thelocarpon impressellum]